MSVSAPCPQNCCPGDGKVHADVAALGPLNPAVTKRKTVPFGCDGRTRPARRHKKLVATLVSELGRAPDAREALLISNAAALVLQGERLTAQAIRGERIDESCAIRISNTLSRLLRSLKIGQRKAPAAPNLQEYLARRAAHKLTSAGPEPKDIACGPDE
jgi:hypothetical protein